MLLRTLFLVGFSLFSIGQANAASSSGFSMGLNMGIATTGQDGINDLITEANAREDGLSVSSLGNAWEFSAMFTYRVGSLIALQFRPSIFTQGEDGKDTGGAKYEYSLIGFTVFPVLRMYLLENNFIKFFSNFGLGWGSLSGTIQEGDNKIDFSGNDLGFMVGLGAEFCFTANHCMNIEGNFRSLSMERIKADGVTGDWSASDSSITQGVDNQEVEVNDSDLGISMSGIVGQIGYIYYF